MGPVGVQEMVFIFLLALVLFGPKKLPELGRTLGKALAEFRRAQSELKATFDREMQNLERETESQKEIGAGYQTGHQYDNYNYDYSSSDAGTYGEPYGSSTTEPQESTVTNTSTIIASATEGAESLSTVTPQGAIAHRMENATEIAAVPPGPSAPSPCSISPSATEGAESLSTVTPQGAIAHRMENATEIAAVPQGPAPLADGEPPPWSLQKELEAQPAANGSSPTEHAEHNV